MASNCLKHCTTGAPKTPSSQGVVLDTGNGHYLEFYKRQGYEEIGEVAIGPIIEHVFFHPSPQLAIKASA